jgi:hypothetical protein
MKEIKSIWSEVDMDNFLFINSVITFVETRMRGKIDYAESALATGFSLPYIRELFASKMNKSSFFHHPLDGHV